MDASVVQALRQQSQSYELVNSPEHCGARRSVNSTKDCGSIMDSLVISPACSQWLGIWDWFMFAVLLSVAIVTPYESAFLSPQVDAMFLFNCVINAFFAVDTCLNFFIVCPHPSIPGDVIKDQSQIAKIYISSWFCVDAVSLIPVDVYCAVINSKTSIHEHNQLKALKLIRLFRLLRMLRLARLSRLLARWQVQLGYSFATSTLIKFGLGMSLFCHWTACIWGGITFQSNDKINWLSALKAAKGGEDALYEEPTRIYVMSMYWSIVTLTSIGYGDITPQNFLEYCVTTIINILMAATWAYVIGAVCGIVATLQPHETAFRRKMDDLNWVMTERDVPQNMKIQFRKYMYEAKEVSRESIERSVLQQMSPKLQCDCAMIMHQPWMDKVWYLQHLPSEITMWIARVLTMAVFVPGEVISEERSLYVVRRGLCWNGGHILRCGDVWGEDMIIHHDHLRKHTHTVAISYLAVTKVHYNDFENIMKYQPATRLNLRWAQIKVAFVRGLLLVARYLKRLIAHPDGNALAQVPLHRKNFYSGILRERDADKFFNKFIQTSKLEDKFQSKARMPSSEASLRKVSNNSNEKSYMALDHGLNRNIHMNDATDVVGMIKKVGDLCATVRTEVCTLSHKVDALSTKVDLLQTQQQLQVGKHNKIGPA